MTLKQLKSEAREKLVRPHPDGMYLDIRDVDTLITTAYYAGIEKAVEEIEKAEWEISNADNLLEVYASIDKLKATLQAKVNKDNK